MRYNDAYIVGLILGIIVGLFFGMLFGDAIDIKSRKPITHTTTKITTKNGVADTLYILER